MFVFTDGPKADAGVLLDFNYSWALSNNASVFTSGLYGISTALKIMVNYKGCNFTIFF